MISFVLAAASCGGGAKPHISKLAFGTNEAAEPSMATFAIDDGIYAVAEVSNIKSKHSLFFSVTTENVAEREQGAEVMTKSVDTDGSQPARLHFSVAYPGEYKIEATLSDDTGKKVDNTFGMITVTGTAPPLEKD